MRSGAASTHGHTAAELLAILSARQLKDGQVVFAGVAVLASHRLRHRAAEVAVWVVAVLAIGLIGVSRIYLGVHYPTDVLGGLAAGTVWVGTVALGDRLAERRRRRTR